MCHGKRSAHGAEAFARAKGNPMEDDQERHHKHKNANLAVYLVLQPHQQKHDAAAKKHRAHRIHQPLRLVAVRPQKTQADSRQQKYHSHQHRRLVHGDAAVRLHVDGGWRCSRQLRAGGGPADLQEHDAEQRERRSHAQTNPGAAVDARFQHRVRRIARRVMHGNFFADGVTVEDALRIFRRRRHLADGDFVARVARVRHLISVGDFCGVSRSAFASLMGFHLRRLDDAFRHRPLFRADAFCEGPNPDAHGDKTDDNEQGTKKLRASAGHLCHEPSLVAGVMFRPLHFAAIFGMRLPPDHPIKMPCDVTRHRGDHVDRSHFLTE